MTKPTVLTIDDEVDILDLLYRTLHREFRVLRADNGPAALEILEQEAEVAVIVSDQRMPMMSGTEFLSLTAEKYPDIIRIIVTGYTDVDDLVEAINSGKVFKYVTKPWDDEDLKNSVRKAVEAHSLLKSRTQDLRRALRRESLLNTVTNTIRGVLDSQQMLQTIVEAIGQAIGADCCLLRPVVGDRLLDDRFIYLAQDASDAEWLTALGDTVWATESLLVLNDVAQATQLTPEQRSRLVGLGIASSAILPLVDHGQLQAVLALHRFGEAVAWDHDDVQLAEAAADQGAIAIAQVRTYERVRDLGERERLVNEITTAIRSSLEPKQMFATIARSLHSALQSDGCALSLWTPEDEYVQCVGFHDAALDSPSVGDSSLDEHHLNTYIDPIIADRFEGAVPRSITPIPSNPVLQRLIADPQPMAIDNLHEVDLANQLGLKDRTRALLVVPLLSEGQIIGSISLRQEQPRRWKRAEIDLAQAVAAQAAIAVQQSRLFQKTRQQAEKLLDLDRKKNELFQNISHEFRTPLTLTIGPLEGAVAEKRDLPYEQAEIALRNSRRLLRLVNQLLDLQRLDAGRMQPTFRPCDLAELVGTIAASFRPFCERRGLRLITEFAPCPLVYLDAERFDKVLYNLLANAVKFTPRGGDVTLRLSPVADTCRIDVADTGIGIRADQIPHLFDRFHQAEGSVNRSYEGTGLGLALVKELAELHGGRVAVESHYGQGTTFSVWIPQGIAHLPSDRLLDQPLSHEPSRAAIELAVLDTEDPINEAVLPDLAHDAANAVASEPTILPRREGDQDVVPSTVLFVDDNPDLRVYVSDILRRNGYRVLVARNGREGIEVARARRPAVIVTDLMMPEVSGLDLIQAIREDAELASTPIVLLTAKADEDTRIEGLELGADGYLAKPFNDRELIAEVRNLIALKANERKVAELNLYLTQSVLRRFLPAALVAKAAAGDLSLDLQPEPRLITVLFTDIVGFTQLSNTLRSRKVAELLNEYLSEMTRIAFEYQGTVDKFMGDAVLVLFGAPEEATPNEQVQRAVGAARAMGRALKHLNESWVAQGIAPVRFRCGIHQGTAVVGMFGGESRSDYTAIGPCVNIASRLQDAAEPGAILISAAVSDYLNEDEIEKVGPLELKGVDETVLTFQVKP